MSATALAAEPRPSFTPPSAASLPDTEFGKIVRQGEQIFLHTPQAAGKFVGNDLNCSSCHLDAGRRPDSAPMWAAYVLYPAYRAKNGHVNTLAERLQGCFRYSMNGKPPAADDPVLTALQTYMFWLASKAPTGVTLEGQGYRKLPAPAQKADYLRGERFTPSTAPCAMALKARARRTASTGSSPPYGADSFNWGAGMHQIGNAAGFIKANMPLGQAGMLSDQEAWDVAYFMNAHERPQDPRYAESVAATRAKYHDSDDSLYGIEVNGHLLGSDSPRPAASCCRRPSPEPLKARRGSGFRPCRAARFVILAVSASHARHLFMHANSGNVFMVVAPSGAGKSSLVRALLQQDPSILLSVSCTTRAPRPGEEDGREYRFVAVDDFKRMRDDQALLEWAEVHGNFYGTPATASTPPPAKDAMCCSRSTGRARARSSSAFRAPSAFSSCRRRSRNSKPGSRRAARTSRKSSRAGSWRRAVKSRTLRNANMLLLIKNLA